MLVVGTVTKYHLYPRQFEKGGLRVYRFTKNRLEFLHETEVDGVPMALCPFQGKLLVGAGQILRIYDLGKKKLLRKCESKVFGTNVEFCKEYC